MSRYCILIPTYQHSKFLPKMLLYLKTLKLDCVIVNDGSDIENTQQLKELCRQYPWVVLVEHKINQGKGVAVTSGLKKAKALGFTHAIQVDSDGQHDLSVLPMMIRKSKVCPEALVSGRPIYDDSVPRSRLIGRYLTHFWVWVETLSFKIVDSMCGFRVYPVESTLKVLDQITVGNRMDFDSEIMVRMFWRQVPIEFLPVKVVYPENGVSHFRLWADNWLITKMHTKLFFGMLLRFPKLVWQKVFPRTYSSHWANKNEKGMILGIKTLLFVYNVLGRKIVGLCLSCVGFYYVLVSRSARKASADFRKRYYFFCQQKKINSIKFSTLSHVVAFANSLLDKLAVWQGDFKRSDISLSDLEHIDQLKEKPQGGVFISGHYGNIEIARALGRYSKKKFTALVYTDGALKFNSCLQSVNKDSSLNIVAVQTFSPEVAIDLKERVDRGEWIFVMGDRSSVTGGGRNTVAEVLGDSAYFPEGPFLLAYLLGSPIYSFFCYRERENFRVSIENITPEIPRSRENRQQFVTKTTELYAKNLTEKIIDDPRQWFNFFNFWNSYECNNTR